MTRVAQLPTFKDISCITLVVKVHISKGSNCTTNVTEIPAFKDTELGAAKDTIIKLNIAAFLLVIIKVTCNIRSGCVSEIC